MRTGELDCAMEIESRRPYGTSRLMLVMVRRGDGSRASCRAAAEMEPEGASK